MKTDMKEKNPRTGSMMVEAIIALSLVTVGILGIVTLVSRSLALNHQVVGRLVSANLAAEGIEIVKSIIDWNVADPATPLKPWDYGINDGFYDLNSLCTGLADAAHDCASIGSIAESNMPNTAFGRAPTFKISSGAPWGYNPNLGSRDTSYKRVVRVEEISPTEIKVNAYARYVLNGINYDINVEDHFFKWRR
jgi:Tfp pilus assembly protein PilV